MKRYFVFGYDYYYPSGGMNDCMQAFESFEEAVLFVEEQKALIYPHGYRRDKYDIVDITDYFEA